LPKKISTLLDHAAVGTATFAEAASAATSPVPARTISASMDTHHDILSWNNRSSVTHYPLPASGSRRRRARILGRVKRRGCVLGPTRRNGHGGRLPRARARRCRVHDPMRRRPSARAQLSASDATARQPCQRPDRRSLRTRGRWWPPSRGQKIVLDPMSASVGQVSAARSRPCVRGRPTVAGGPGDSRRKGHAVAQLGEDRATGRQRQKGSSVQDFGG
jgi:hypothetical protein